MNIFVGGLTPETTAEMLQEAFEAHGEVESARIVKDTKTGESKGFGFVEMPDEEEGRAAIEALHESEFNGKTLRVEETKGRPSTASRDRRGGGGRPRSGGFRGRPGGSGGGRGGRPGGGPRGRGGRPGGGGGGGGNRRGGPRGRSDRDSGGGGRRY